MILGEEASSLCVIYEVVHAQMTRSQATKMQPDFKLSKTNPRGTPCSWCGGGTKKSRRSADTSGVMAKTAMASIVASVVVDAVATLSVAATKALPEASPTMLREKTGNSGRTDPSG